MGNKEVEALGVSQRRAHREGSGTAQLNPSAGDIVWSWETKVARFCGAEDQGGERAALYFSESSLNVRVK